MGDVERGTGKRGFWTIVLVVDLDDCFDRLTMLREARLVVGMGSIGCEECYSDASHDVRHTMADRVSLGLRSKIVKANDSKWWASYFQITMPYQRAP